MAFQRGKPRPENSGRKKGTPNSATQAIEDKLRELGCDPIEGMAKIAMDEDNAPELRGRMFAELAQFVFPKRKAIEYGGVCDQPIHQEHYIRFVD
jgi:hypothetical protein